LGYPNMGNAYYTGTNPPTTDQGTLDLNVKSNVLLIANYDYATAGIVNPTNGLPASLYRTNGAPSWWGTNRWPAIDPVGSPVVAPIPAQLRYLGIPSGTRTTGQLPPAPPNGLHVADR
jgi:hypothetical protein